MTALTAVQASQLNRSGMLTRSETGLASFLASSAAPRNPQVRVYLALNSVR